MGAPPPIRAYGFITYLACEVGLGIGGGGPLPECGPLLRELGDLPAHGPGQVAGVIVAAVSGVAVQFATSWWRRKWSLGEELSLSCGVTNMMGHKCTPMYINDINIQQ